MGARSSTAEHGAYISAVPGSNPGARTSKYACFIKSIKRLYRPGSETSGAALRFAQNGRDYVCHFTGQKGVGADGV